MPDSINISQEKIDSYWTLWMFWRATGQRFLPSQLKKENIEDLEILLTLDSIADKIIQQQTEQGKAL